MSYLLDTCVISELMKPSPDPEVASWVSMQPNEDLFLSVVTLAEIQRGIYRLPQSAKRTRLQQFLDATLTRYRGRIIVVDPTVANRWASETAATRPLGIFDSLLAATALVHGLTVVTRNEKDMPFVSVFNPSQAKPPRN